MSKTKQMPQAKKKIQPEKVKGKSEKNKQERTVIKIPNLKDIEVTPQNILAVKVQLVLKKKDSNLFLPSSYKKDERKPGGTADIREKEFNRWFVVKSNALSYDLHPGDEIFIADQPQAIGYTAPILFDHETGYFYNKFDQTEIHGYRKKEDITTVDIEFFDLEKLVVSQ